MFGFGVWVVSLSFVVGADVGVVGVGFCVCVDWGGFRFWVVGLGLGLLFCVFGVDCGFWDLVVWV